MKQSIAKGGARILFAAAIAILGYCGFVLEDTWRFQKEASVALSQQLHRASSQPSVPQTPQIPGLVGRIEITRLGLSVIVMEGSEPKTLRRAAGHILGTALPGEHGNVGISAHRDTLFRPLKGVRIDDTVLFTTPAGEYRYRVVSTRVVGPDSVSVLDSDGTDEITLITCYPFYFVGPAPNRFVVRAERIS
jgi:sortase A